MKNKAIKIFGIVTVVLMSLMAFSPMVIADVLIDTSECVVEAMTPATLPPDEDEIPEDLDSDGDGVSDADETQVYGTDPYDPDDDPCDEDEKEEPDEDEPEETPTDVDGETDKDVGKYKPPKPYKPSWVTKLFIAISGGDSSGYAEKKYQYPD